MPDRLRAVRSVIRPFSFVLGMLFATVALAQPLSAPVALDPAQAQTMVQRTLATELRCAQDNSHPMRYRLHKSTPRLSSTKEIAETMEGDVARLLAINEQPLNQVDQQKEQDRLNALLTDPSRQRHRKQSEDQDTGIVLKLLRMLPQAFVYQYAGVGSGPAGAVQKFTFRPNPSFTPPDIETQSLTSLTGELWIDAASERVTRLEGHLQADTNYGWGVLGKLDKGGYVIIEQADAGNRQWRIARVQMRMTLRILFKTKNFDSVLEMSQYTPLPPTIDYRQAIQVLRQ